MYDSEFDTEWADLSKNEALERAFALGVARGLGTPDREAYERVRDTAETTYERSLIELAYEEGRTKSAEHPGTESAVVWEELVIDTDADPSGADSSGSSRHDDDGPPEMFSRAKPTAVPDDGLDRMRLPAFLRRR
ncbi:hypothetical protein [Haloplanus sp.]|uniref:hypothetical protein n=1 Tax=Haloplanus sp. TaxID=1961696 RepID=UPI0026068D6E|nr:hypothetical protein [Haloplanus sp.]